MATWDDVRRIATTFPEVTEDQPARDGGSSWRVRGSQFVWARALRPTDVQALRDAGAEVPEVPTFAASVPDLTAKEALIADAPEYYFTVPHFNGYKAILVKLPAIPEPELEELLTEAWLCRAPKRLASAWLGTQPKKENP